MKKYLVKEYKKHVKLNIVENIIYSLAYVLLVIIVCISCGTFLVNLENKCEVMANVNYSHVVESDILDSTDNCYFKFNNLITVNNKNKKIHTNAYMALNDVEYQKDNVLYTKQLKENEVAISTKIKKKLSLNIGDEIQLEFPLYDDPLVFVIGAIIPYLDDCYDYLNDSDFSVIKIGYNEKIFKQHKGKYVSFMDEYEYKNDYVEGNKSYIRNYDIKEENKSSNSLLILFESINLLLLLSITIPILFIVNKRIKKEINKYYIDGYRIKWVTVMYKLDKLLYILMPSLVILLLMFIFYQMFLVSFVQLILVVLNVIGVIFFCCLGGKDYEKIVRI